MHYVRNQKYGDVYYTTILNKDQTKHYLYRTYGGMKKRCLTKTDKDYERYGGAGVKIDSRWLGPEGFFNFIEDMGDRPEGLTLDRIDSKGDYSKSNCRWADPHMQAKNKKKSKNNGVSFYKLTNKYRSRITVKGTTYMLGFFNTIEEALEARRLGEIKYLGHEVRL